MTLSHRFRELTWPEVNKAIEHGPTVLIPVGAIEQHGPHLPVDVDNTITEHLCEQAALRSEGDIMTMPAVHYGYNAHNMDFPGTISIRMETFIAYLVDVGASLAHQGFRHLLLVNAHGSNGPLVDLIARRLTVEHECLAGAINHWELGWDFIRAELEGGPYAADHACEWETSEYLAIRPELVQTDLIRDEIPAHRGGARWLYPGLDGSKWVHFMNWWSRMNDSGVAGTPSLASAEKGQRMLEGTITRMIEVGREFRQIPLAERVDHRVAGAR
ncbi:MAG: creatininase family protein [Rubellimicrobium sp.]|nr:creatininase family protein [Rubellimicrobium sp.]